MTWKLFYPSKVTIVLYEDDGNHHQFIEKTVFHVRAEDTIKSFDEFLEFPGTPMTKTDDCFLQWKDRTKGFVWGLKFSAPADLESFLRICLSGLSSGRVAHTTGTRALADALDGGDSANKTWPSHGSLGRPASVVESSIDEAEPCPVARVSHLPTTTEASVAVDKSHEPAVAAIAAAVAVAVAAAAGESGDNKAAAPADGVQEEIAVTDQSVSNNADGDDEADDEDECTYIDDLPICDDSPPRSHSQPSATEDTSASDPAALQPSPVENLSPELQSPTDSFLDKSGNMASLSMSLTTDVLSQFPDAMAVADEPSPIGSASVRSFSTSLGPSSPAAPPLGFLHSTENLHENDGEENDLPASPPVPPEWVESGLTLSNVEAASTAAAVIASAARPHAEAGHASTEAVPVSTSQEELRTSMYSPGIVPMLRQEHLDSGFAGSDNAEENREGGEAAASGSMIAVLRSKLVGGVGGEGSVGTTEGTGSLVSSDHDQDADGSRASGNEASAEDAATMDKVQGRRHTRTRSKSDRQSLLLNGSTRRAGWLELKNVLYHKNGRLAPASHRKWKKCWGVLRDTLLTLHKCTERGEVDESAAPVLKADVTDCIAQSAHEYVYRDFVMSLSSQQGHTHFLQATNHSDVDAWVEAIHRAAALGSTSADSRDDTITVLQGRCASLQSQIETQSQMKQMASLQVKSASGKVKAKISEQISSWSEEVEGFNVDLFKWKCYIAALKGSDLPNPQNLLACASKATKASLRGQVANFSVASFHSLVVARQTARSSSQRAAPRQAKKTGPEPDIVPLQKKTDVTKQAAEKSSGGAAADVSVSDRHGLPALDFSRSDHGTGSETSTSVEGATPVLEVQPGEPIWKALTQQQQQRQQNMSQPTSPRQFQRVELPDKQSSVLALLDGMTAGDVLDVTCEKRNLDPDGCFLVLGIKKSDGDIEYRIANLDLAMKEMMYDIVEVREKQVHTVSLALPDSRTLGSLSVLWGFEADICEGAALGQPSVFVTEVLPSSVANTAGLCVGDEILTINTEVVEDQSRSRIIELLQAAVLTMVVRSCKGNFAASPDNNIIDELVCPAPPTFDDLTDVTLEELMVPKPPGEDQADATGEEGAEDNFAAVETEQIDKFLQNIEELNAFLLTLQVEAPPVAVTPFTSQAISKERRLSLCAQELVDTERLYIKRLSILLDRYLEPLRFENFISKEKFELIFGNSRDVLSFQRQFLQDLEDALKHISSDDDKESPQAIRLLIFSLSGSVLFYMRRFKMYSSFCVSHMEANLFLNSPESLANEQLQEFLRVRNPKKDSAMSFSSLLIMPILRLMRYPLFLETMRSLAVPDSTEQQRLAEAKAGMEHMADYINEMQRINDHFGVLFHKVLADCAFTEPWLSASVNHLCHYVDAMWLNASQSLMPGHWKKGVGPSVWCYVFKSVIIILRDEQRGKRKSAKNLADAPSIQQAACTVDDLQFYTVVRTSRAKVVDLPDSDGVRDMWQLVNKTTEPATTYLFRSKGKADKQTTLATVRQVIRDRSSALTALTPGTARRRPTGVGVAAAAAGGVSRGVAASNQLSITSYARHHEASSTTTRVVSPDEEDLSGVLNRSAQLRTSNRRRRASECGRTAEAAAAAALNASENYFVTDEMSC